LLKWFFSRPSRLLCRRTVLYNDNYYSILYIQEKKMNVYRRRRSGYCVAGKYGKENYARKIFLYYTFNIMYCIILYSDK